MIGIMFVAVIVCYVLLSKLIVTKMLQFYGLRKANIALAIMILIPTWDVILGAPIYAYLCLFKSGVKIYKTVDNVEGFYVGEQDTQYEPYKPYKGYKYIEYQETNHSKSTGKYYRSYWVNFWEDTNASKLCVSSHRYDDAYAKAVKKGHCIIKEEISKSKVSRWEVKSYYIATTENIIPVLDINKFLEFKINDRNSQNNIAQVVNYSWKGGWIWGLFSSVETGSSYYITCYKFRLADEALFLQTTLKPKGDK